MPSVIPAVGTCEQSACEEKQICEQTRCSSSGFKWFRPPGMPRSVAASGTANVRMPFVWKWAMMVLSTVVFPAQGPPVASAGRGYRRAFDSRSRNSAAPSSMRKPHPQD